MACFFRASRDFIWSSFEGNSNSAGSMSTGLKVFQSKRMTMDEALLILNIHDASKQEEVYRAYARLFAMNDPGKGGSFYLQSKVFRALEYIEKTHGWASLEAMYSAKK
jgi:mitochondrial import inner membrane translocase subunit TIM16